MTTKAQEVAKRKFRLRMVHAHSHRLRARKDLNFRGVVLWIRRLLGLS